MHTVGQCRNIVNVFVVIVSVSCHKSCICLTYSLVQLFSVLLSINFVLPLIALYACCINIPAVLYAPEFYAPNCCQIVHISAC